MLPLTYSASGMIGRCRYLFFKMNQLYQVVLGLAKLQNPQLLLMVSGLLCECSSIDICLGLYDVVLTYLLNPITRTEDSHELVKASSKLDIFMTCKPHCLLHSKGTSLLYVQWDFFEPSYDRLLAHP